MQPPIGFLLAVLGGSIMGSFSLPMKRTTRWAWENTWLVWAFVALVILPWVIALNTVPGLLSVYSASRGVTLLMVFLFGIGWGLGAVTFGQSIALLGMSLSFAVSLGLTLALGALVPMARNPMDFLTASGACVTAGIFLMVGGVIVCAVAGRLKESQERRIRARSIQAADGSEGGGSSGQRAFVKGLTLCVLSGFFNPMLNFALSFGGPIRDAALAAGATGGGASDAIWAITLMGGFVSNAACCAFLLTRNRRWSSYTAPGTLSHWFLAATMGASWLISLTIYGRAVSLMGRLGDSAGWAITMGCCIAASNFWGIAFGEWREGRGRPLRTMALGLALILAAIAVIGVGNGLAGPGP